jgi:hypothetical protein
MLKYSFRLHYRPEQKGSKVVYMQSPAATNVANKTVNYTTTSQVQTELTMQRDANGKLL